MKESKIPQLLYLEKKEENRKLKEKIESLEKEVKYLKSKFKKHNIPYTSESEYDCLKRVVNEELKKGSTSLREMKQKKYCLRKANHEILLAVLKDLEKEGAITVTKKLICGGRNSYKIDITDWSSC